MGFKCSMVIIHQPTIKVEDKDLLEILGFSSFEFSSETTLEECIYPCDKSINIGNYNNSIIICDDYLLTRELEESKNPEQLSYYEEALSSKFPDAEILTVACHSVTNYHLYSLVKNGNKLRFKSISGDTPIVEFGQILDEEEIVYSNSKIIDGERLFKSFFENEGVYENTEDQMMEDFAFGVAQRHLGVKISTGDDDELMFETNFRKYLRDKNSTENKVITINDFWASKDVNNLEVSTLIKKAKSSWLSRLFK